MEEIVLRCLEVGMPTLNFAPMCMYSTGEQLDLFVEPSLITAEYLRLAEKYQGRIALTAWNLENEKKYGNCWANLPEMLEIDCDGQCLSLLRAQIARAASRQGRQPGRGVCQIGLSQHRAL